MNSLTNEQLRQLEKLYIAYGVFDMKLIPSLIAELIELRIEVEKNTEIIAKLRKALEFYAGLDKSPMPCFDSSAFWISYTCLDIARQALEKKE